MRIFEILLLVSIIYLFVLVLFAKSLKTKVMIVISRISMLLLCFHLIVEGYRWPMFILYLATIYFNVITLHNNYNNLVIKKKSRLIKFSNILLLILTVLSIIILLCLPVFKIPRPTGSLMVGTKTFHFVDESREEIYTEDDNDKRELLVQVWYPAQNIDKKKRTGYVPGGIKMLKAQAEREYDIPEIFIDYLKYIKSNSYEGAEISSSSKTYPIIFLNHGWGTNGFNHTSLAENLASNGYIVAAIDFTHSTAATIFPDGLITYNDAPKNTSESSDILAKVWSEDIKYVISQFEMINSGDIISFLKGKIDFDNLGICGHSFGGGVAYYLYNNDSRIKAGINMDGSLLRYKNMKMSDISNKPFMFLMSERQMNIRSKYNEYTPTDEELKKLKTTRKEYELGIKTFQLENDLIKQTVINGGYEIYINNADHYNFTDWQLYTPLPRLFGVTGMIGKIKGERGNYIVNQYVLDFFNKYLKMEDGNLLSGPNKKYPEVDFVYYE